VVSSLKLRAIPRLVRIQFTPVIIAPVVLGAAVAWHDSRAFPLAVFLLALVGSVSLHLAANGIDDVYDYVNGTDKVSERMFPPEAPGWKPLARGALSVGQALTVSYLFYGLSLMIAALLSFIVGWFAMAIALPAILLSYFYTAPPLRLDYRGLGLGELSVLLSFGPIPALGAYYVVAGHLSVVPALVAASSGLLTTGVLVSHDLIYYDVYRESGKKSLAGVLGRRRATLLSTLLPVAAYCLLVLVVLAGVAPPLTLLAVAALPVFAKFANLGRRELDPPAYGARTMVVFVHSILFTFLVAVGFLLG
jgi:1,4-dihydroxy-2-naphthoate octaprenyltransferase